MVTRFEPNATKLYTRLARLCATGTAPVYSEDGASVDEAGHKVLTGRRIATAGNPAAEGCWQHGSPTGPEPSSTWQAQWWPTLTRAKAQLLGVDPALIEAHGAVSEPVAQAMAAGALQGFGADTAAMRNCGSVGERRKNLWEQCASPSCWTMAGQPPEPCCPGTSQTLGALDDCGDAPAARRTLSQYPGLT